MISRQDVRHDRPRLSPGSTVPSGWVEPGDEPCEQGGLAVVNGGDLTTAITHFGHCIACQREFVGLGGLLPAQQAESRSA
jgi:hypothetical protein